MADKEPVTYRHFTTPSGIVVAETDVVKVLNEGSFLIPALSPNEREDSENVRSYYRLIRQVEICAVHCFDGRDYWRELWRDLLSVVPADHVMRLSLAGAATSPKRFLDYLVKYEELISLHDVVYPVFTHDPCGRYGGVDWNLIQRHGWNIVTGYGEKGYQAFNIHFHLDKDEGMVPMLFDPFGVVKAKAVAALIHDKAMTWSGRHPEESGLDYITGLTLCSTSLALGYPPPIGDKRLVLCEVDHGEIARSIVVAQKLNHGEPVPVRMSRLYYNQL